jgi:hypothetical protein
MKEHMSKLLWGSSALAVLAVILIALGTWYTIEVRACAQQLQQQPAHGAERCLPDARSSASSRRRR